MVHKRTLLTLSSLALLTMAGCPLDGSGTPLTGNLNLSPGFGNAVRVGTTSGIDDSTVCTGFFPENPNHIMTLTNPITGLAVTAASTEANVVLYIRFGGSSFCAEADDPTIQRGSWSAGEYEIYVGTEAPSTDISYTLTVSEP